MYMEVAGPLVLLLSANAVDVMDILIMLQTLINLTLRMRNSKRWLLLNAET